ncbi:Maff2 family mobile element protein [Clostridioides difficile]
MKNRITGNQSPPPAILQLFLYQPCAKSQGMKQLMAGGGVALIGITLVPLLSGLFG